MTTMKLNTKELRKQKITILISTEESLRDVVPYYNNKRRDLIMENLVKMLQQLEEERGARELSAEERTNELMEIENHIKNLSEALHKLFNRKYELEVAEEEYKKEQELLNEEYRRLHDFYAPKK